jgi:hypothetical protein
MLCLRQRFCILFVAVSICVGCGGVEPASRSASPLADTPLAAQPTAQPTRTAPPAISPIPTESPIAATEPPAPATATAVSPVAAPSPTAEVIAPTESMTAERCNQIASDHLALAPGVAGSIKSLPLSWPVREGGGMAISPAFPTDQVIVASGEDGLYRSTDAGATWRQHVSEPVRIARFSPNYGVDHTIFALGTSKKTDDASIIHIYRSTDEGATWAGQQIAGVGIAKLDKARLVLSPTYAEDRTLYVLVFGYVTYSESHQRGVVYRSTDGGSTWSSVQGSGDQFGAPYPYDMALSPDYARDQALIVESMAIGGAVSSSNGLYHSTDGGETWTRRHDIQLPLFTALVQLPSQQIFGRQPGSLFQIKLGATIRNAQSRRLVDPKRCRRFARVCQRPHTVRDRQLCDRHRSPLPSGSCI